MKTSRKIGAAVLSFAVGAGALAYAPPAGAQEIQLTGPLAGAPAVRKLRKYRQGRVELMPEMTFTLLDEYRRTIMPGAALQYNLTDWLGIRVLGDYGAISTTTDLTDQINTTAPRNDRTKNNVGPDFTQQVAKIQYVAGGQVEFIPFRGKLALFQKLFVDTDLYAHLGAAAVGLQERGDCNKDTCTQASSFALQSRVGVAPLFGLGFKFYTGNFIAIGLEYRAFPILGGWNRSGFDQRGAGNNGNFPDQKIDSQDRTFKFNQAITLGVGFSFPTTPTISE